RQTEFFGTYTVPIEPGSGTAQTDGLARARVRLCPRELLRRLARLLQRRLLLLEVLLEERDDVLFVDRLGLRDQAVVDGDLVRLALDHAGEDDGVVEVVADLLQFLLAFLFTRLDRRAGLLFGVLAERLERALEVAHLLLCLAAMLRQVTLQLAAVRLLLELLEHGEDRVLHL